MQVRNHPLMVYTGRPSWPPQWQWISGPKTVESAAGEAGPEPVPNADLAAYLAGEAVSSLRHHEVDVPSLADVLIQRSREVRFTVDRTEAVTLLAATIREQRLKGILEGLRLAGLLNEPSKDRHAGITS